MDENGNGNDPGMPPELRPAAAVRLLRERGVDQAEAMLALATPEEIMMVCARADARGGRVGPGLIVQWIRAGEFEDPKPPPPKKGAILRARFDAYAARYAVGETTEPHAALIARRWPDDLERNPCAGDLIVWDATYPNIAVECDACGFEAAYSLRSLHVLGAQLALAPEPVSDQPF